MKTILAVLAISSLLSVPSNASPGEKIRKEVIELHNVIAGKLAQARVSGLVCEAEAYVDEVISELMKGAGSLGVEALRSHVKRNPVFTKVLGDNFAFRANLSGKFFSGANDQAEFEKILIGSLIYGPAHGAYGNTQTIEFKANGVLVLSTLDIDTLKWVKSAGTYKVFTNVGFGRVEVDLGKDGGRLVFELDSSYPFNHYRFNIPGESEYNGFSSSPSECEA